jgi:hypothetical protein
MLWSSETSEGRRVRAGEGEIGADFVPQRLDPLPTQA